MLSQILQMSIISLAIMACPPLDRNCPAVASIVPSVLIICGAVLVSVSHLSHCPRVISITFGSGQHEGSIVSLPSSPFPPPPLFLLLAPCALKADLGTDPRTPYLRAGIEFTDVDSAAY